ncbi:MAG: hypothetical protein M0Z87_10155 [Actinomycetota bacterium]|nr:hypothetical protein [Actinomycetota bacterium]
MAAGMVGGAVPAFASTTATTYTCSSPGVADECTAATNYASSHHPGSGTATVLKVEADTEYHGGSVARRVFDIRVKAPNGTIYVEHVLRNESSDSVWWESVAESQTSGGTTSSPPTSTPPSSPPPSSPPPSSSSGGVSNSPKISSGQAGNAAIAFVRSYWPSVGVSGVKNSQLNSNGQKDYYQVKLQLNSGGRNSGTTVVWVDATSSAAKVTAVQGSGLSYRDSSIISPATAQSNASAATGASSSYHSTQINGGKWRWYWVFLRSSSGTKYKVGVDAVTGQVTQVHQS